MKYCLPFLMVIGIAACNTTPHKVTSGTITADTLTTKRQATLLKECLQKLDVPAQIFTVSAHKATMLTGKKGTVIYVTPEDLELEDGSKPTQDIRVELKELTSRQDMLKAQAQTVAGGRLLVSGGSYYVNMTSAGRQLHIKKNGTLKMALPRYTDRDMSLFYGERDKNGQMNWQFAQKLTSGNSYAASDTNQSIMVYDERNYRLMGYVGNDSTYKRDTATLNTMKRKKQAEYFARRSYYDSIQRYCDSISSIKYAVRRKLNSTMYDVIALHHLGWINCDRFNSESQRTNITYSIAPQDSIKYAHIYMVFKDINSVVDNNYYADEGMSTKSFGNIPIGYKARLIAVAYKKDTLFTCSMDMTIADNRHTLIVWKPSTTEQLNELFSLN